MRSGPDRVEVHVVLRHGATVSEAAGQIRRALVGRVGDRAVDIAFEDVADPQDVQVPPPPPALPSSPPLSGSTQRPALPGS